MLKNELKNLPHLEIQYHYTLTGIQCCTRTEKRLISAGESGSKQKLFRNVVILLNYWKSVGNCVADCRRMCDSDSIQTLLSAKYMHYSIQLKPTRTIQLETETQSILHKL